MSSSAVTYLCTLCNEVVSEQQQSLECPVCSRWQHRRHPETKVSQNEYYAAGRGTSVPSVDNWKCWNCSRDAQNEEIISDGDNEPDCDIFEFRSQDIHKELDVACVPNNIKIQSGDSLNSLFSKDTIFHKIKNFFVGTADAKIVNTELSNWILDPERSAEEILQLVSKDFKEIPGVLRNRDQRAWLVFMVIHNINKIPGLIIEGTWLDVILCLINYTYDFDFQTAISIFVKSQNTRNQTMQTHSSCCNWVIKVLSSNSLCASPYLQLELIRHIYNKKSFTTPQIQGIMQGVVNIISNLNPEQLFTVLGHNLHCTPEHILFALHFPGIKENEIERQRNILGNKIQRDLKMTRFTKEIAFFANTMKYTGFCAQVMSQKYSNDAGNLIKFIHQCLSLFMFGSFNPYEYGKLYQSSAYKNTLLLPFTFDGIGDITETIVGIPMTFMSEKGVNETYAEQKKYLKTKSNYKKQFNKLMKRRNNLIRALDLPYSTSVFPKMFALREINGQNVSFNRKFQKEIYKQKYIEYKL
ncbi:unnamed protein product [Meganyctiphanes norvegica]|uniref:Uncharacterized protein n=1 Tax=Meganyctiphanes norvegica TaxID=48144 RepID=A0AAV2S9L9_MEGNR